MPKRKGPHAHHALNPKYPPKTPGSHADGNGLYLVVEPNGNSHWILRAVINGKRRKVGLGSLRLVPFREAREKAEDYKRIIRRGGDLLSEIRKPKVPLFRNAAKTVHEHYKPSWKNPKHAEQWINTLEAYAFPVFGDVPVDKVDSSHILRALTPIWQSKPETASRLRQRIAAVLDWARAAKYRTAENPVHLVSVKTRALARRNAPRRHFPALPYAEIPEFVKALRSTDKSAEIVRLAVEFAILTAARTTEVRLATRNEIDSEVWTIPGERMKAKKDHRVPLSPRAVQIIERATELGGESVYLFPTPSPRKADHTDEAGKPLSENGLLQLLKRMEKYKSYTVHGFRSSFRDWCAEQTNHPAEVAEAALAHTIKNKVEAAYRRTDHLEQRRKLMNSWGAFICGDSEPVADKANDTAP